MIISDKQRVFVDFLISLIQLMTNLFWTGIKRTTKSVQIMQPWNSTRNLEPAVLPASKVLGIMHLLLRVYEYYRVMMCHVRYLLQMLFVIR